jgi:hypothetical protein
MMRRPGCLGPSQSAGRRGPVALRHRLSPAVPFPGLLYSCLRRKARFRHRAEAPEVENPPTQGRRAMSVGAGLSRNQTMRHIAWRQSHWRDPSALQIPTSTQTRPEYGFPFAHCVNCVIPLQDHVLHAPHCGRGKGRIAASTAGGVCSMEAGGASSKQRGVSAAKGREGAGDGASPARDEAGRERRSSRAKKQREILIAWNLLFTSRRTLVIHAGRWGGIGRPPAERQRSRPSTEHYSVICMRHARLSTCPRRRPTSPVTSRTP